MTCNQIILLFHIKRGTIEDNENIGTHRRDIIRLLAKRLIEETFQKETNSRFELTDKGEELVTILENLTKLI